jgi:hypothetical protein
MFCWAIIIRNRSSKCFAYTPYKRLVPHISHSFATFLPNHRPVRSCFSYSSAPFIFFGYSFVVFPHDPLFSPPSFSNTVGFNTVNKMAGLWNVATFCWLLTLCTVVLGGSGPPFMWKFGDNVRVVLLYPSILY